MASVTEVSPRVQEALAVLAAGGLDPNRLGHGMQKVRELVEFAREVMHAEPAVSGGTGVGWYAPQLW